MTIERSYPSSNTNQDPSWDGGAAWRMQQELRDQGQPETTTTMPDVAPEPTGTPLNSTEAARQNTVFPMQGEHPNPSALASATRPESPTAEVTRWGMKKIALIGGSVAAVVGVGIGAVMSYSGGKDTLSDRIATAEAPDQPPIESADADSFFQQTTPYATEVYTDKERVEFACELADEVIRSTNAYERATANMSARGISLNWPDLERPGISNSASQVVQVQNTAIFAAAAYAPTQREGEIILGCAMDNDHSNLPQAREWVEYAHNLPDRFQAAQEAYYVPVSTRVFQETGEYVEDAQDVITDPDGTKHRRVSVVNYEKASRGEEATFQEEQVLVGDRWIAQDDYNKNDPEYIHDLRRPVAVSSYEN